MATGACGVSCDVCRLNLRGTCSTCGFGTSQEGRLKMAAQERLLGAACPVLACAVFKGVDCCLRDCVSFPCDDFSSGPNPFSQGFLNMQRRRRTEKPAPRAPYGGTVAVPESYWTELRDKTPEEVCESSGAVMDARDRWVLRVLNEDIRVDVSQRCLQQKRNGCWERVNDPYLELVTLVYLLNAERCELREEMVGVHDLKDAHFFQGPHALRKAPLLARFGQRPQDFKTAAQNLGGTVLDMADAAVCLMPFPRIPVYYILWAGDEEFAANLSVLFDKSIERHLSADAVWGLVTWVSDRLIAVS